MLTFTSFLKSLIRCKVPCVFDLQGSKVLRLISRVLNFFSETRNNHKLMMEYEKYHELQRRSQKMQEDYDRQLRKAEIGKQHSLEELTEFYETKLQEKSSQLVQVTPSLLVLLLK